MAHIHLYCIYDKNNLLTKHTFYQYTWFDFDSWRVDLMLTGENNDVYHGPSVYTNYYNGAALAKDLGININDLPVYKDFLKAKDDIKLLDNKSQSAWTLISKY